MYHLQTVEGYDPLYIRRYGELIAASERDKPDISPPFGFNRIITPHKADSRIIDLLGVKYILSWSDLPEGTFIKIMDEGQTKLYKNPRALQRSFFVQSIKVAKDKQQAINTLFDPTFTKETAAVVEDWDQTGTQFTIGTTRVRSYKDNEVVVETKNSGKGFLVLTDTFYPTWHAKICNGTGQACNEVKIYRADYNFRGVVIPKGKHTVVFYNSLL